MRVCIIGMGEIGLGLYRAMERFPFHELTGMDIDVQKVNALKKAGVRATTQLPLNQDVYVVAVLTSDQVKHVLANNIFPPHALIVVESTLAPGTSREIIKNKPHLKLVIFPHRFNPDTADEHGFLNVNKDYTRVIAASTPAVLGEALAFYSTYMDTSFLHQTSMEIAELCKPLENAYRFVEIAIAEELKMLSEHAGIDFTALRAAVNTKWNIDIKEARDGVGRHCLPKDIRIINQYFGQNIFFHVAQAIDERYKSALPSMKTLNPQILEK